MATKYHIVKFECGAGHSKVHEYPHQKGKLYDGAPDDVIFQYTAISYGKTCDGRVTEPWGAKRRCGLPVLINRTEEYRK